MHQRKIVNVWINLVVVIPHDYQPILTLWISLLWVWAYAAVKLNQSISHLCWKVHNLIIMIKYTCLIVNLFQFRKIGKTCRLYCRRKTLHKKKMVVSDHQVKTLRNSVIQTPTQSDYIFNSEKQVKFVVHTRVLNNE